MKRLAFALVAAAAACTGFAAEPVVVWDRDFSTLTKGAYTLSENGNTKMDDYLLISGSYGITITSTSAMNVYTVIMRCEGLNLSSANAQVLFTSYASDSQANLTGMYLLATNANTKGIWDGNDWSGETGATKNPVPSNYTTLIYNHQQTNGTYAYALGPTSAVDNTLVRTTLYSVVGLRSSGTTYYGCNIGGLRGVTSETLLPATGLKITALAVFNGTLTEEEMKGFAFESERTQIAIDADTTVSAINTALAGAGAARLNVADGVTITMDAAFDANSVSFVTSGTVKLSSKCVPSAAEMSKFDFSGVEGALVRSWIKPGVVGLNFAVSYGADTESAIANGEWFRMYNASGVDSSVFQDGLTDISWDSANVWRDDGGAADETRPFIRGYLDDNANRTPVITISRVPYESYDVIIYCSTDSENFQFSPKEVNGDLYRWDSDSQTTVVTTDAYAGWGSSKTSTTAELGINAIKVQGLSGPLTIKGGQYSNTTAKKLRGCISAIQIMPAGVESGAGEVVIDAKAGMSITDSTMLANIRTTYRNVRVLGEGSNGVTMNFGSFQAASMYVSSHIVFDGGTHSVTMTGYGDSTVGTNSTQAIIEVMDGTTLDLWQHDLSGWLGSAAAKVPWCNIQVDAGGELNVKLSQSGTTYYQGRYTICPGATLTSHVTTLSNSHSDFRMNGGSVEGCEQIYVPDSAEGSQHAVIAGVAGNTGLFLAGDNTAGCGVYVGENSTLDVDIDIGGVAGAPLGKWGEGTLCLNGDMSGYAGTFTINAGTVVVTTATTLANVVNNATLAFAYGANAPTFTSYSGSGTVEIDVSGLTPVAGESYTLMPGVSIDASKVALVGLGDNTFHVRVTEAGVVLTDTNDFYPEWTGGSGTWSAAQFDGRDGSTEGLAVVFAESVGNAAVSVSVEGQKNVASLAFTADSTTYTLSGDKITASGAVSVSGASPVVVETALAAGSVAIGANTSLTLATDDLTVPDGGFSGSGTLTLDPGAGKTNTMSAANTSFTGEAIIASGTVKMGDKTAFGPLGRSSAIRVKGGAVLSTGCHNGATEGETNRLILEDGATYTSYASVNDTKLFPISRLVLEGNANIVADVANVGVTKHYNDPTTISLGGYTLTKTGANTLFLAAATITGQGVLRIAEGTLNLNDGYYDNAQNKNTFADGTLRVDAGAVVNFGHYQRDATLAVKNLVLDGSVTCTTAADTCTSTLTVTGYATGSGTTPILTLGANAVIKPTNAGYLTVTESLNGTVRIDLSDVDFASAHTVTLFKVGSAEMLPAAADLVFTGDGIPNGWDVVLTSDGLGYKLNGKSFNVIIR